MEKKFKKGDTIPLVKLISRIDSQKENNHPEVIRSTAHQQLIGKAILTHINL